MSFKHMLYFMWYLCMDPWRVRSDLSERSEMAKGNVCVCEEWQITRSCVVEICCTFLHHGVLFGCTQDVCCFEIVLLKSALGAAYRQTFGLSTPYC